MDSELRRTMWCPKRCDLLSFETRRNKKKPAVTPVGTFGYVVALSMLYVIVTQPPNIVDKLPSSIPMEFYWIIIMLFGVLGVKMSTATFELHVCPTCKGVLLDSNAIEQKFLDKTRIGIIKLLNESTEQSELQCSSCTDYMHVIKITYDDHTERVRNTGTRGTGSHRNILLDIVLEEVADVIEKGLFGYSKMKIEGCKQCSSFWFDKGEMRVISRPESQLVDEPSSSEDSGK